MGLDRRSALPLWAQLLDELRPQLDRLGPGERLPTEQELTSRYGVSRNTVRQALRELRFEGRLVSERGRRSRVPVVHEQQQGMLWSLFRSPPGSGAEHSSTVLALRRTTDPVAAHHLEVGPRTPLVYLERLRLLAGEPLAHDRVWLPADLAGPLLEADLRHRSLYDELLARCAIVLEAGEETVSATLLERRETRLLGCPARSAGLVLHRRSCWRGRFVEWRETVVAACRFRLHTSWPAGPGVGAPARAGAGPGVQVCPVPLPPAVQADQGEQLAGRAGRPAPPGPDRP